MLSGLNLWNSLWLVGKRQVRIKGEYLILDRMQHRKEYNKGGEKKEFIKWIEKQAKAFQPHKKLGSVSRRHFESRASRDAGLR